ncbi:MAG: hypothetical protein ABIH25_05780 [Candidatus Woesearchaeota archaeon]
MKKSVQKKVPNKIKVSHRFVTILSIVSILGFVGIISHTLFDYNLSPYIESFWMFIIGFGITIESRFKRLQSIVNNGLTSNNFTHLTTVTIGAIAILAGLLSLPFFGINNPAFLAMKGIISIIAIVVIFIQTWIVE